MPASLTIQPPSHATDSAPQELTLGNTATIGRSRENLVALPDSPLVSRQHAVIRCHNGFQYQLIDLGSRNGTFLNDQRVIMPVTLQDGAQIRIGHYELTFRQHTLTDADETMEATVAGTMGAGCAPASREVAMLVCDVRGFSTMSEKIAPPELAQFIGGWFREAGEVVNSSGGTIDKFIGDAMLAYWSTSQDTEQSEREEAGAALEAAFRILEIARPMTWPGLPVSFDIAVALHHGRVTLSNIGLDAQRDATIIGDAVNIVFRLEKVAKQFGCALVASQDFLSLTPPNPAFRDLGEQVLKGKNQPVQVLGFSGY